MLPIWAVHADDNRIMTAEEILDVARDEHPTPCATEIFSNALIANSDKISQDNLEHEVRAWAQMTMTDADVLEQILKCPEVESVSDETTVVFTPVVYTFPNGRMITINYSTQPKVIKQKLILARKPSLPTNVANPKLMDFNDPAKYLDTEPSWYAVMVVQHDSLKDFVGHDKNNTLSLKYLDEHIDEIYPKGYYCTSRSAIANDMDTVNRVVHQVLNIEDDSNDYYVAGDINLEWVMYAEIVADIIITVASFGAGQLVTGAAKGARATKAGIRLAKSMNKFKKSPKVLKYIHESNARVRNAERASKLEQNLKNAKNYEKALDNARKAREAGKDAAQFEKEADDILKAAKKIDPDITEDMLKNADNISDEIKSIEKSSKEATEALQKTLEENRKLLEEKKKLLKTAKKNADPRSVADYDKKYQELQKLYDMRRNPNTLKKAKDVEKNEEITQRIEKLEKTLDDYETASSMGDYGRLKREIVELESVDNYIDTSKELENIMKYRRELRGLLRKPTGNFLARSFRTFKAINSGALKLNKANRVARAGLSSRSARVSYWLKDQTLKFGSRLGRFESKVGLLYGAASFLGDMYDQTSTTSKEFSNGIEFKPFCLLSADDLEGQDNVVNYGMWLMWTGNSVDDSDDDAAYLQAMDFASKFAYQLNEYLKELPPAQHVISPLGNPMLVSRDKFLCNVDIYVVHPFIRLDESDTNDPKGEMYYLFMNETPWTTAEYFDAEVSDVQDWERNQKQMYDEDPYYKHTPKPTQEASDSNTSEETVSE